MQLIQVPCWAPFLQIWRPYCSMTNDAHCGSSLWQLLFSSACGVKDHLKREWLEQVALTLVEFALELHPEKICFMHEPTTVTRITSSGSSFTILELNNSVYYTLFL